MATMTVSLPDQMKDWVEAQVQLGRYADVSDYVRDLICKDRDDEEKLAWLKEEIRKGDESPDSERTVEEIWQAARARAVKRSKARTRGAEG